MIVAGSFASGDVHDPDSQQGDAPPIGESPVVETLIDPPFISGDALESAENAVEVSAETPTKSLEEGAAQPQQQDESLLFLITRLQTLEREFSLLQGRIEELEYRQQEEQHMNRRRFLDMDRRLREQFGSQLAPEDTLTAEEENSEKGLYRRGMAFLDAANYEQAALMYKQLINDFPNGERVPDSMYWLAEIHRNAEPKNLELARQNFVQMVTLYADHAKVPEALTKLGMIYHELGNESRALEYFDRVQAEFPDHDAAGLAETYAQELR